MSHVRVSPPPRHDAVLLFVPDLAPVLAAVGTRPVLRRSSPDLAHVVVSVAGHAYEFLAPASEATAGWPRWSPDECPAAHAPARPVGDLVAAYDRGRAQASDGVRAWAEINGFFPPQLAGVNVAVPSAEHGAAVVRDLGAIARLEPLGDGADACAGAGVAVKVANADLVAALRFVPTPAAAAAAAAADAATGGLRDRADDWGGWSHWLDRHVGLKYVPADPYGDACAVGDAINARLRDRGLAAAQRTAYDFSPLGELHWYAAYPNVSTAVEYHVRDCVSKTTDANAEVCMCVPSNNHVDFARDRGGASCYDPPANAGTTRGVS